MLTDGKELDPRCGCWTMVVTGAASWLAVSLDPVAATSLVTGLVEQPMFPPARWALGICRQTGLFLGRGPVQKICFSSEQSYGKRKCCVQNNFRKKEHNQIASDGIGFSSYLTIRNSVANVCYIETFGEVLAGYLVS